jgi:hypothetical protein
MTFQKLCAAFLLALSAAAAEVPLPELRIEPATGGSIFFVKNVANAPLTAYLVELVNYPGSYYALWQDDVAGEPLAPGAERRLTVANMTVGAVPDYVKMRAALYADGSSAGIPERVAQLTERRRFILSTTRELIGRLEKTHAAGTEKAAAIADLKQWADSMQPGKPSRNAPQTSIDQTAARTLILETAAKLDGQSLEEVLPGLRAAEHALAVSKPAL